MAKTRNMLGGNSRTAHETETRLRQYHQLGVDLLREIEGKGSGSTHDIIAKRSQERRYAKEMLYKAVQFATLYSTDNLESLCGLKSPDGMPLGIGHICQLIAVPDRRDRVKLQRDAAREGWSARQLLAERKLRFGPNKKARKSGRKPRMPGTAREARLQLTEGTDKWLRWVRQFQAAGQPRLSKRGSQALNAARTKMEKLLSLIDPASPE